MCFSSGTCPQSCTSQCSLNPNPDSGCYPSYTLHIQAWFHSAQPWHQPSYVKLKIDKLIEHIMNRTNGYQFVVLNDWHTKTGKASLAEIVFQKLFGLRRACRFLRKRGEKGEIWQIWQIWRFHVKTRKIGKSGKCPLLAPPIDHCLGAFASQCPRAVRGIYFRKVKFRSRCPRCLFFSPLFGNRGNPWGWQTHHSWKKCVFRSKPVFGGSGGPKRHFCGHFPRFASIYVLLKGKRRFRQNFGFWPLFQCFSTLCVVVCMANYRPQSRS